MSNHVSGKVLVSFFTPYLPPLNKIQHLLMAGGPFLLSNMNSFRPKTTLPNLWKQYASDRRLTKIVWGNRLLQKSKSSRNCIDIFGGIIL
jgi:hypothetical protein